MNTRLHLGRGLALTAVAWSLATVNSFALTNVTPAPAATAAASTGAPATHTAMPSRAKLAPPQPASSMTADIRDIRGPKHVPSPWLWPLWLASGAALAALLYGGWLWNRRRALARVLLPYELALARLEEARALMQPESAREFSIAVSEIVRQYIEGRFQVWAARRTTEEFLYDLLEPSDTLLARHGALLADFLRHCDLAKFARWILSFAEMATMLQSAQAFVLETGRSPTPAASAPAAPPLSESTLATAPPVPVNL